MMTTTSETPLRAGTEEWATVAGNCFGVVGAHVLAPLPHVSRHVEQSKLICGLQSDGVRSRVAREHFAQTVGQAPADLPAQEVHQGLIRAAPPRSEPRDLSRVIAPTEGEVVLPPRTAAGRVLPFRLRRKPKDRRRTTHLFIETV